jgi:HD-GYP domain-containing protein (c-di-GMP phosphodiesterase class II)
VAEVVASNPLMMATIPVMLAIPVMPAISVMQAAQVTEVITQPQAMSITKDPFVLEAMNNLIETSKSVRKVFYDTAQLDGNTYEKYDGVNTVSDFTPSSLVEVQYPTISTLSAHANPATQKMIQEAFYSSAGHMTRVADLSLQIASNLNLPSNLIDEIFIAGKLHDIGLPNALSNLSASEFAYQMLNETQLGYQKLKEANFSDSIAQMVQQHHEKIDGSGFMKLSGDSITMGSRILAIADTLESLSGHGNHLEALEPINMNRALQEIHNGSGRHFDPKIVQSCMSVFSNGYLFPTTQQASSRQINIV